MGVRSDGSGRWGAGARWLIGLSGAVLLLWALLGLERASSGLEVRALSVGETPATLFRSHSAPDDAPTVLIAHGFAGSQQLMRPFAITLARRGYRAITFDFEGHGRHPAPMSGDITREDGVGPRLIAQMGAVADAALAGAGNESRQLAVLGHSMAADLTVRFALEAAATGAPPKAVVAVSIFTRAVTAEAPSNLLIIAGAWETFLSAEARRLTALSPAAPAADAVRAGARYGEFGAPPPGARGMALAEGAEHIGVLYAADGLAHAADWIDAAFGRAVSNPPPAASGLGLRLAAAMAGALALAWPLLTALTPRAARPRATPTLSLRAWLAAALLPAALTPLLLQWAPHGVVPVLIADYLALHFFAYGALSALVIGWAGGWRGGVFPPGARPAPMLAGAALATAYAALALGWPADRYFTAVAPTGERFWLVAALFIGAAPYFLTEAWLARADSAPTLFRGRAALGSALLKTLFLLSLAAAVALDPPRLFFLIIILPAILVFFVVFGLLAGWVGRASGHPWTGALMEAAILSMALAAVFPLVAAG